MPAWAGVIQQDDVWKIVAFIRAAPTRSTWPWSESRGQPAAGMVNGNRESAAPATNGASTTPADDTAPLTVELVAHRWWWDIVYKEDGAAPEARTANELHLPVGRQVRLVLRSADVPHELCAPMLDDGLAIEPGRVATVHVRVDQPGLSIGACRDFFNRPDTRMQIVVAAEPAREFDEWLARQRMPAAAPVDDQAARGHRAFLDRGCVVCHTIRGTAARGRVAPDLTHVAGRQQIANGVLGSRIGDFEAWIAGNETIKPGNKMPSFKELDGATLRALGRYLESLQ
jgi:cytochrome c oxidase subunit 2